MIWSEIALSPNTKILLDAIAALQQLPPATVVEKALFTYRDSLDPEDRTTLDTFCGRAVRHREALQTNATGSSVAGQPKVTCDSTRLCFKRERIEQLEPQDHFRTITPVGVFQMSKAEFYQEFPNVVASESYKAGVYHYPRLPSKAERFRVPEITVHGLMHQYEKRIQALLGRWREALLAAGWPTTEQKTGFEELPTKHPVYTWGMHAEIPPERRAHVVILLEGETDPTEEGGFLSVVNCFASISFGVMGSDHVRWDVPRISVLLDDSNAFEEKFHALEQVTGAAVVSAIEEHLREQR